MAFKLSYTDLKEITEVIRDLRDYPWLDADVILDHVAVGICDRVFDGRPGFNREVFLEDCEKNEEKANG
jgi:hypothetical protein